MIILGIDPGSRVTGYGFIRVENKKISYVSSGIMKFDLEVNFFSRLKNIFEESKNLASLYNPDVIALESLIYVKNVSSLYKLAQARGAILSGLLSVREREIFEYSPNLVKSSVTGFGHADKHAVAKTMKVLLGKSDFKTADESDALAIAICHYLNSRPKKIGSQKCLDT